MQLGLTLTWLFIFPDTGLSGRIRGRVLSSEAGMVDKGQMTRVTESPAKSGLYLGGFPSPTVLSDHLHQNPLWVCGENEDS